MESVAQNAVPSRGLKILGLGLLDYPINCWAFFGGYGGSWKNLLQTALRFLFGGV